MNNKLSRRIFGKWFQQKILLTYCFLGKESEVFLISHSFIIHIWDSKIPKTQDTILFKNFAY